MEISILTIFHQAQTVMTMMKHILNRLLKI